MIAIEIAMFRIGASGRFALMRAATACSTDFAQFGSPVLVQVLVVGQFGRQSRVLVRVVGWGWQSAVIDGRRSGS